MSKEWAVKMCASGYHIWTQSKPGLWPYKGQPCFCGEAKFEPRKKEARPTSR